MGNRRRSGLTRRSGHPLTSLLRIADAVATDVLSGKHGGVSSLQRHAVDRLTNPDGHLDVIVKYGEPDEDGEYDIELIVSATRFSKKAVRCVIAELEDMLAKDFVSGEDYIEVNPDEGGST